MTFFTLLAAVVANPAGDLACLRAQELERVEPKRRSLRGRVVHPDGKPWVGATVVVAGIPSALTPFARGETLRARTDARGSFRVSVLPSIEYAAWAYELEEKGATGVLRFKQSHPIVRNLYASSLVKLRSSEEAHLSAGCRLRGLAAWKAHAPLRFELRGPTQSPAVLEFEAREVSTKDGVPDVVDLQPLDWPGNKVVVRGASGRALFELNAGNKEKVQLTVPTPRAVRVRVKRKDSEELIANARVMQAVDGAWREIGVSNAKGECKVYPYLGPRSIQLLAIPQATALTLSKQQLRLPSSAKKLQGPLEYTIECIKSGAELRGRLFQSEGRPLAAGALRFFVSCPVSENSWYHKREAFVLETGKDGRFVLHGVPDRCQWRLFYVDASSATPFCLIASGSDVKRTDLGDIVLSKVEKRSFVVRDSSGAPAPFARILVGAPRGTKGIGLHYPLAMRADRRGRAAIRADDFDRLLIAASHGSGYTEATLRGSAAKEAQSLTLGKTTLVYGKVVDQRGRPVVGAEVRIYYQGGRSRWTLLSSFGQSELPARRSREDGSFRFECVPGTRAVVRASTRVGKTSVRSERRDVAVSGESVDMEAIELRMPEPKVGRRKR